MVWTTTAVPLPKISSSVPDFDASISSGLAIMATQKHLYVAEKKQSKIKQQSSLQLANNNLVSQMAFNALEATLKAKKPCLSSREIVLYLFKNQNSF